MASACIHYIGHTLFSMHQCRARASACVYYVGSRTVSVLQYKTVLCVVDMLQDFLESLHKTEHIVKWLEINPCFDM